MLYYLFAGIKRLYKINVKESGQKCSTLLNFYPQFPSMLLLSYLVVANDFCREITHRWAFTDNAKRRCYRWFYICVCLLGPTFSLLEHCMSVHMEVCTCGTQQSKASWEHSHWQGQPWCHCPFPKWGTAPFLCSHCRDLPTSHTVMQVYAHWQTPLHVVY